MKIQRVQFRSPFCIFTDFRVHGTPLTTALFLDRIPFPSLHPTSTPVVLQHITVWYIPVPTHRPPVTGSGTRKFRIENIFEI